MLLRESGKSMNECPVCAGQEAMFLFVYGIYSVFNEHGLATEKEQKYEVLCADCGEIYLVTDLKEIVFVNG